MSIVEAEIRRLRNALLVATAVHALTLLIAIGFGALFLRGLADRLVETRRDLMEVQVEVDECLNSEETP